MPVNRVRAGTLPGSQHVVILSTSEHEYTIAGADYLRIVRGEQPITRDEIGCLAAALHQAREFPIRLIGDACDPYAPRQRRSGA